MKTELMATISHEARTPLAVLSSYAGLVATQIKTKGTDEQTDADLDKIIFEAKRVADLIESMKRFVMADMENTGKSESPQKAKLNLSDLVKQTTGLYRYMFEEKA